MQDVTVFTISEVAQQIKLSHQTTLKLVRNGTIGAIRAGHQWRVTNESLDKFFRGGGVSGGEQKSGTGEKRAA